MSGKKLSIAILGALLMTTTVCSQGVSAAESRGGNRAACRKP